MNWKPIDSAPVNQSVLIYVPNAEHYGEPIYRAIQVDMGTGKRWMTTGVHIGRDLSPDQQPTGWQPLPPPPSEEQGDEAKALKGALTAYLSRDLSFDAFVKKFGFSQEYCDEYARLALAAFWKGEG